MWGEDCVSEDIETISILGGGRRGGSVLGTSSLRPGGGSSATRPEEGALGFRSNSE